MPSYKYICTNETCHKEVVVNCLMKDYSPTAICESCKSIAERNIKDLLPQNYIVKCDGFYGGGGKTRG